MKRAIWPGLVGGVLFWASVGWLVYVLWVEL